MRERTNRRAIFVFYTHPFRIENNCLIKRFKRFVPKSKCWNWCRWLIWLKLIKSFSYNEQKSRFKTSNEWSIYMEKKSSELL
jgi:hypothetical protein